MSDATLKIELIGATDEEKSAFNAPAPLESPPPVQSQSPDRSSQPGTPDAVIPASEPQQSQTTDRKPSADDATGYTPTFESVDALIKKIDELITLEREKAQRPKPEPDEPKQPDTFTGRIADKLDRFMQRLDQGLGKSQIGNTPGGRMLRAGISRARVLGGRAYRAAGRTRVGRAIGRGINRVAARFAPAAARTGGAAAGAGAAGASTIASLAGPVAAVGAAAAGTAVGLVALGEVAHSVAKTLEDLSPELARTRALFEANRELARLDRAQRLGPGLAQIEQSRNRLSESMYEVQTKILEIILKFAPLIEGMLDGINVGVRGVDVLIAKIGEIWSRLNDLWLLGGDKSDNKAAADALAQSMKGLQEAINEFFKMNQGGAAGMDPWLAELFNMPVPGGNAPLPPNANFP